MYFYRQYHVLLQAISCTSTGNIMYFYRHYHILLQAISCTSTGTIMYFYRHYHILLQAISCTLTSNRLLSKILDLASNTSYLLFRIFSWEFADIDLRFHRSIPSPPQVKKHEDNTNQGSYQPGLHDLGNWNSLTQRIARRKQRKAMNEQLQGGQ